MIWLSESIRICEKFWQTISRNQCRKRFESRSAQSTQNLKLRRNQQATRFRRGSVTALNERPAAKAYTSIAMVLEIPKLDVSMPIVGVPQSGNSWDATWLGNSAGCLAGSAFPTWAGNTVITGHVWDAWNQPGIFSNPKTLGDGDPQKKPLALCWGLFSCGEGGQRIGNG